MNTATELLRRALEAWDNQDDVTLIHEVLEEIRTYLAAEPEAETIETLKAENFKLASGQCTEGGPWGDEGGTPYCKYTNPAEPAKKPMTDFREYFEEMHSQLQEDYGDNVHIFEAGFKEGARWVQLDHSVFKHHGIGDADL